MDKRVLLVLMWKNALIRKRRCIQTLVECLATLLFFLLLFLLTGLLKTFLIQPVPDDPVANTDMVPLDFMAPPPRWILYQPESPVTKALMDDVGAKLNLKRVTSDAPDKISVYFSLPEGSRLADYTTNMQILDAVVIFRDMSGETWPNRLNYTIRMNGDFHTELYKDEVYEPNRQFGTDYALFMRIQWAIDSSYIKQQSKKDVPLKLATQEFPYYRVYKNIYTDVVCKFLTFLSWLSLIFTFIFLMSRLVQERTSGMQELMKMEGVSLSALMLSHVLNVLPCGLIFATGSTILLKVSKNAVIPNSSPVLLWLVLFLFFSTIVSIAFACSYIPTTTQYAITISALLYMALWVPARLLFVRKMPYLVRIAVGFVPFMPLHHFWTEIAKLELFGDGVYFSNMTKTHDENSVSVLVSIITMILQCVLFFTLSWYLSLVRPGQYGQALPWNFCFKSKNEVQPNVDWGEEEEQMTSDPRYFEPAPRNVEVGIKVINVSKVYSKFRILRNISLEVYKGEITVLLGHNGAGKTTLMNVITGMTSANGGQVYVNGMDTVKQSKEIRKNLGFCPQHNLFFEDLTVQQNIMFFTLLKKGSIASARMAARQLAESLRLSDKLKYLPSDLSGGMKRRMQLGCALAGDASVLVLDEPTSGLDVESRRELWDLLLSLRGERTVLLTTHFMEEADALGDRVAAVHQGVLRCFATTMHLKKAIGTGYRLSLTTIGSPKEGEVTAVVKSHVPDATLKEQTTNTLTYNLPATHSGKFPELFSALEANRSELGLDSIGVGVSTLEEVFLKLCSDVDTSLYDDEVDHAGEPEPPPKQITGAALYMRQWFVLIKRQVKYAICKKWIFLVANLVIPIGMIICAVYVSNQKQAAPSRSLAMNLDMYDDNDYYRLLYRVDGSNITQADVHKLQGRYPKVTFGTSDDIYTNMISIGKMGMLEYKKYLVGIEVNDTDAKILYTAIYRHAAPVSLNLLSNLLAAHYIPSSDGNTITTMNYPISDELKNEVPKEPKDLGSVQLFGIMIVILLLVVNGNHIGLLCQERQTGSRHIHIMSGCPAELHWLATLSIHMLVCALNIVVPTVVTSYFLDKDNTINQSDFLGAFALILVLGSLAYFPLLYLLTINFDERSTSLFTVVLMIVFAIITPLLWWGVAVTGGTQKLVLRIFLPIAHYAIPQHTLGVAAMKSIMSARTSALCKIIKEFCPLPYGEELGFNAADCCLEKPVCYFCMGKKGIGTEFITLTMQFVVLMAMVILTERGVFNGLLDKVMNLRYKPPQDAEPDKMVRAEKAYVSKAITMPAKEIPDAMLLHDLHKNYPQFCNKNVNALKGVSLSVKKGECFGILGVNGAGKSTCFKMITAEESITRGNIFCGGYHLTRGNSQYLQTLGYCPQFFGLDMFLTGKDNLALVLTLRGYDNNRIEEEAKKWINIVGLEKYADQRVEGYSGGCVRRLGAATALCAAAQLSLLDEPSAGVDVAARRRMWVALRKSLKLGRAVAISSHSMDEMEALCSRIAILAGGHVRALGTAAGLRAAHAQGHAVMFKLTQAQQVDEIDGANTQINRLQEKMQQTFNCTLKDVHKTMLHYHINETMRYSELFAKLESLRERFPSLIEDYSVTETTLEEVFLSFAKEQQQNPGGPHAV
ncbi:hypothetical protein PYW08_005868 [Mythimna loreyi]|uniref:Uncharacterized protein n=1 Tax=Mythimna loreyi TaxID=667449 RepID=A0ACC2QKA1_9NEOP|nr:hypothetical protein PYW08_005868 [Mythimna loreyi]